MISPESNRTAGGASKMVKNTDQPKKHRLVAQHEQTDNQKMLAEKYNDEKLAIALLILGAGKANKM